MRSPSSQQFNFRQRPVIRRRELPSFGQFRWDVAKLVETARIFQQEAASLLETLRNNSPAARAARITRTAAVFAALASLSVCLSIVKADFVARRSLLWKQMGKL